MLAASPIWLDGSFQIPIVTGGNDAQATEIRAYLVPAAMPAPLANGTAMTLPPGLASFPTAQVTR